MHSQHSGKLCSKTNLQNMMEHEDLRKHEDAKEHLVDSHTEPSGVEPQPVLPRDIFSNRFTFCLYFLGRCHVLQVFLMLFVTCLFIVKVKGPGLWAFFSVVTGFGSVISSIVALERFNRDVSAGFELEQSMRFLSEIRDARPGMSMPKWDTVASRMNDYLFETGHYPNRYAFYDGQYCCKEFKENYPLSRKDVFDAVPLEDSPHGVNGGLDYFKMQISRDYYDSVDEYLTEIYEGSSESRCTEV